MSYGIEDEPHLGGYWLGGDPNTYCPTIWDYLTDQMKITSFLDIGCGEGHAMEYMNKKGVLVHGVDGAKNAYLNNPLRDFVKLHDYTKGEYVTDTTFDIGWCTEFVEHIEQQFIPNFIATFKKCKWIMMTHAVVGQEGYHHVNCQYSDYWIDLLTKNGFEYDAELSVKLTNMTDAMHIKRGLLCFKNKKI